MDRTALTLVLVLASLLAAFGCDDDAGDAPKDSGTQAQRAAVDASHASDAAHAVDAARALAKDAAATDADPIDDATATGSCVDGIRDGDETDVDCGGDECGGCHGGRQCKRDADCASNECEDGTCSCLPLEVCPEHACGTVRHCGGELDCGECDSGVCYQNRCCQPRACAPEECGAVSDGCGGTMRCGAENCCKPRTCEDPTLDGRCGDYDDRCGGTLSCGCTDTSTRCYVGECCTPATCDQAGRCGFVTDGCGGVIDCGCAEGMVCRKGECCQPLDCSGWAGLGCAVIDDGCGGILSCGCADGEVCNESTCCQPSACPAGAEGDACGTVADGCGGVNSGCACQAGLSCFGAICCTAKSCSELGADERCGYVSDGCGGSVWCGCDQFATGMRVSQGNACGHACADTLGELRACAATANREELVQTAGWDFGGNLLSTNPCTASYGFVPNWTDCHNGFQVDARGYVHLNAGMHCFSLAGNGTNSCGVLYFVTTPDTFAGWDALPASTPASAVTGGPQACFTLAQTGYYPIRWHFTLDGTRGDFRVDYCPNGGSCAPMSPLMLLPTLP